MSYILIIGAKSDIAKEVAKLYAKKGYSLYLAGREINTLDTFARDLQIRYDVSCELKELDVTNFSSHRAFYDSLKHPPYGIIAVAGYMAEQKECESSWQQSLNTINVNYTGLVSLLNIAGDSLERQKEGFIIGVSSVAGDRGRKTNYIYGSSKAGFSCYLSGLRNRLSIYNINVLTVIPGFVMTKMTQSMDLPKKLTSTPVQVAKHIFSAQEKGNNIIYTKKVWRIIMLIIRNIPEFIFKKMSL